MHLIYIDRKYNVASFSHEYIPSMYCFFMLKTITGIFTKKITINKNLMNFQPFYYAVMMTLFKNIFLKNLFNSLNIKFVIPKQNVNELIIAPVVVYFTLLIPEFFNFLFYEKYFHFTLKKIWKITFKFRYNKAKHGKKWWKMKLLFYPFDIFFSFCSLLYWNSDVILCS